MSNNRKIESNQSLAQQSGVPDSAQILAHITQDLLDAKDILLLLEEQEYLKFSEPSAQYARVAELLDRALQLFESAGQNFNLHKSRFSQEQIEPISNRFSRYAIRIKDYQTMLANRKDQPGKKIALLKKIYDRVFNAPIDLTESAVGDSVSLHFFKGESRASVKDYNIFKKNEMQNLRAVLSDCYASTVSYQRPAILIPDLAVVNEIAARLHAFPDGRILKSDPSLVDLKLEYSIYKWGGRYFVVDKGAKYDSLLGRGGFGVAKYVQNIQKPAMEGVLKIQQLSPHNQEELDEVKNELAIINHLYGNTLTRDVSVIVRTNQHGENQAEFIMPLAKGRQLADFIYDTENPPTSDQRLKAALAVMRAYKRVQAAGVLHRDIHLGNIFYDEASDEATFIDFGLAHKLAHGEKSVTARRSIPFGCQPYNAGEFIDPTSPIDNTKYKKVNKYSEETEVYSLGVVLAETFFPRILRKHVDRTYVDKVKGKSINASYHYIDLTSPTDTIADLEIVLVNCMMHKIPTERCNVNETIKILEEIQSIQNTMNAVKANAVKQEAKNNVNDDDDDEDEDPDPILTTVASVSPYALFQPTTLADRVTPLSAHQSEQAVPDAIKLVNNQGIATTIKSYKK